MVMIAIVTGHTFLELDVGEMSDQLCENGSAGIHPPLFRRCGFSPWSPFWPLSVQIVFRPNASYHLDSKRLADVRKVLYRTAVSNRYVAAEDQQSF
jgi:hypothetical protein